MAFHPYPPLIRWLFNARRVGPPVPVTSPSPCPWIDHSASRLPRPTIRPYQTRFRYGSSAKRINLAGQVQLVGSLYKRMLFFPSRRRHTRWPRDWSSDVCSSDLELEPLAIDLERRRGESGLRHGGASSGSGLRVLVAPGRTARTGEGRPPVGPHGRVVVIPQRSVSHPGMWSGPGGGRSHGERRRGEPLGRRGDALVARGERDPDVAGAPGTVELTGRHEDAPFGERGDDGPAVDVLAGDGGPQVQARLARRVDAQAGRRAGRQQHLPTPPVALALLGDVGVVGERGGEGGL